MTFPPIPMEAIASVHSRGDKSPHLDAVDAWLRAALALVPAQETWTTRQLIGALGIPETDQLTKKRLTQSLWVLRSLDRIGDCFTIDPTRRWFGNPLILWTRPTAIDEGIF